MPWDAGTQQEYTCCYCVARSVPCECDLERTTGGCWVGDHYRCNGTVNSARWGKTRCRCRCHDAVTEDEVQAAIASIKEVIR